ncbi:MAG: response regulator [Eubacterium sp.]|nr:response regulator [Eubacterium sp.]
MKQTNVNDDIRELSHIALVVVIMGFSVLMIILNFLLDWERWTIPLAVTAFVGCPVMHVTGKPDEKLRLNIYAVILLVEMFYYSCNVETVFDSTPVVIVALVLLAMTQVRFWVPVCICVGYLGMIVHLIEKGADTEFVDQVDRVVRTVWAFLIIFFAGIVVNRLVNAWSRVKDKYEERIETVLKENKSATDFLANVSHEIRTPINVVIGLTGVCEEAETNPAIRTHMESIQDAGKRVSEQISDILDYSEIDRGQLFINEEEYMISSLLNDVVEELKVLKNTTLELVIDVDPAFPNVLRSDVSKIKKILWHLISNGLKYTKEGGVYVKLYTIPQEYGVNLRIEVTDTGVGMENDEIDRIFDQFYQSDSGRTRSTSGLGLGLSIVSGFVRIMGGFLTIESRKNVGTTVKISLPQKVVDPSPAMSLARPGDITIGGYLQFDKFPVPKVREFYNRTMLNIVNGLHLTMHRVDNLDNFRTLQDNMSFTHLFVGQQEYESDAAYIEELSERMLVFVVTDRSYHLPKGSRINLIEKPFYAFPIITALNRSYDSDDTGVGQLRCEGVRALVVDDEPMNLIVARGILERYGMEVTTVESGLDSLKACREHLYDIVFMDHMMPGMDGVETMKKIRSEAGQSKRYFPIVMLTANAVSSAREMFMREGFDGFIPKPIDLTDMERVLKRVLPSSAISYVETEAPETETGRSHANDVPAGDDQYTSDDMASDHDRSTDSTPDKSLNNDDVLEFDVTVDTGKSGNISGTDNDNSNKNNNKNNPNPNSDTAGIDRIRLARAGVDYDKGLGYCMYDAGFYRTVLTQYASDASGKRADINRAYEENNWTDYKTYVHALKSSSKTIGATELSDLARLHEDAAKENNIDLITDKKEELFDLYKEVSTAIAEAIGLDIRDEDDESDSDDILEFAPEGGE